MTAPIRVLVVDDSAFARKVLREVLTAEGIEVVGIARDGIDALEKIVALKPDVITLDLVMPHLDGLGVLKALPPEGAPRVIIVTMVDEDSEVGVAALRSGAFDVVHKPSALAVSTLYELGDELVRKVRAAAASRPMQVRTSTPVPVAMAPRVVSDRLVVLGTSTGGPQALTRLLRALPADFPMPIAIALHIPPGYTETLSRRLNEECAIEVLEASDRVALKPGRAIVARAGYHLKVVGIGVGSHVMMDLSPKGMLHRPSVDVLFESAAATWGARTIGVVLTGMGDDGTRGAKAIKEAGGTMVTEAESSCVVYGMPRSVREAGLSDDEAPLDEIAAALIRHV